MDSYHKILNFPQQFLWEPEIEHRDLTQIQKKSVAICGMGGSALAGEILRTWLKKKSWIIHRDFHLPQERPELLIAMSYSGNTEEALSAFEEARAKRIPIAAIASGGKLEVRARELKIPFIKLPSDYQPREALGFMIRALAEFVAPRHKKELQSLSTCAGNIGLEKGKTLGKLLSGKIPLIYTSKELSTLAYNWKIKFNETGKTPAFTGIIPELFHNEMTSFDMGKKTKKLAQNFAFIILEDPEDSPEIKTRMRIFKKFAESKHFLVFHERLANEAFIVRFMRSVNLADWTAYYLAQESGADPEQVPWVEEFKKLAH